MALKKMGGPTIAAKKLSKDGLTILAKAIERWPINGVPYSWVPRVSRETGIEEYLMSEYWPRPADKLRKVEPSSEMIKPCPFCGSKLINLPQDNEPLESAYLSHIKVGGCPFSEFEFDGLPELWNQRITQ